MKSIVLALVVLFMSPLARAIEEPAFEVLKRLGNVELRQYSGYVVAEVEVPGPAEQAGNRAFGLLAGYIFGKNKGERKMAMTAPVTQAATPLKMEMTAPVTQAGVPEAPGTFRVQFVLPRAITMETAPEPLDARVRLREVPPHRLAAVTFSGFWSQANYDQHLKQLQDTLKTEGLAWAGEPVYSRYDAPWTPWFMRRNEIWLALP